GVVEAAPAPGLGRAGGWRAPHDGTRFDEILTPAPPPPPRGAADLFLHEIATVHAHELATWLGNAHAWPQEWRRASDMSDYTLRLTPERSHELILKMHALIDSYKDLEPADPADEPAGTESVRFHLHAFPRTTG
ncbi:transcriptional regulator, partial [Streptomyces sp. NPDC002073]